MISINVFEIIMQMINFLILMVLLNKLLFKPVIAFLDKREESIKKSIETTEENQKKSEELIATNQEELQKARQNARDILSKAEEDTGIKRSIMIKETKEETEHMLINAQKELDQQMVNARNDLKKYVGDLSLTLTEKIIKKNINKESQTEIINEYLESVKN